MSPDTIDPEAPDTEAPTLSTPGGSVESPAEGSGDDGDLSAGRLIGDRFRIVGRLGSGGMGVVYRADDLVLGTSVALKFLPPELVTDPVRLERLRSEVRLARRVSHPNVCCVYDIGDADGRPFLSMEHIDGEDLASLLRRIGRLPQDKAVELTREICAGVAAAHELGVIHRDLKPANVMIDGRGRARVADFGLASAKGEIGHEDIMAGTPAYMAPEQFRGAVATRQTDIYALGLLLYELFTGKRAHDAASVAAAARGDSSHTPTNPSDLVDGLDPQVERVIMACLADDAEDRPPSALAVLAALPGGDPLTAVLKAGETPSPELVAASGRAGTIPKTRALQLGAAAIAGLVFILWFFGQFSLGDAVGGILPPEVLSHRAQNLLAEFGHEIEVADSAWGHDLDWALAPRFASVSTDERRELYRSDADPPLRFWYRSSPEPMIPWQGSIPGNFTGNIITPIDPPLTVPGMAFVRLGPRGNLLELRVVPDRSSPPSSVGVEETMLAAISHAAGLEPAMIEKLPLTGTPPESGPETSAWQVTDHRDEVAERTIVVTTAAGRPTQIHVSSPGRVGVAQQPTRADDHLAVFFFIFFVGGALLAVHNVRRGQFDRRGASRLAVAALVLCFTADFIGSHHSLSPGGEVHAFFTSAAYGSVRGLMTWILYVAIEPFIRRLRPKSLVSWSRLLAGRITDPAVGRDVLIGLAVVTAQNVAVGLWFAGRGLQGSVLPYWVFTTGESPLITSASLAMIIRMSVVSLGTALGFLLVYVIIRQLCGRFVRVAPVLLCAILVGYMSTAFISDLETVDIVAFGLVSAIGGAYLVVRHGLLALAVSAYIGNALMFNVLTVNPTDWYFPPTAIFSVVFIGLTVFGVKVSAEPSGSEA